MNKKAAGEIIAWVLLLGFAISLAIGVYSWSRTHTEELTESTVTFVEGKLECAEININVKKQPDCSSLNISNKGMFNIDKISIASLDGSKSALIDANLIPLKSKAFTYQQGSDIEVMPIIILDNKNIGCIEKKIIVGC